MKSLRRSDGKIFLLTVIGLGFSLVTGPVGCVHSPFPSRASESSESNSMETTLSEDRAAVEELRKNIPSEKKRENDQLKEILSLMGEVKEPPQRIREKFDRSTQRLRDEHNRKMRKERERFNHESKKKREEFFDRQKEQREEFKEKDSSRDRRGREKRQKFYDDQDRERRDFLAEDRETRDQFNADSKQKNDDFNYMMRERSEDFKEQLKAYTFRYNEYMSQKKSEKLKANSPNQKPTEPLKAGDDHE